MTALATQLDDGLQAAQLLGAVHHGMSGLVVPYNTPTDVGLFTEEFSRGAFTASIAKRANVPLLLFHNNTSFPIGRAEQWDDRYDGLYATFRMDTTSGVAQYAASQAAQGFLDGLSVGFSPVRSSWRYAHDWNPDLGPDYMDHVTRHSARLHEVSLTPTPAYADARVHAVHVEVL